MTVLPDGFQFSQSSLQDFVDCRRRFQLRYLDNVRWPALESEPAKEHELFMRRGTEFHHFVQQSFLGVPLDRLETLLLKEDEELSTWWHNYLNFPTWRPTNYEAYRKMVEISMSAPFEDYRLIAKFDLLLLHIDGKAVIVDWKTSHIPPSRRWLAERIQTRLYQYMVANTADRFGVKLNPGDVTMIYWYPSKPEAPIKFNYNGAKFQEDAEYFRELIDTIQRISESVTEFPLTTQESHCRFCVYRSLCDRGVQAGRNDENNDEWQDDSETTQSESFDFDQALEIAY